MLLALSVQQNVQIHQFLYLLTLSWPSLLDYTSLVLLMERYNSKQKIGYDLKFVTFLKTGKKTLNIIFNSKLYFLTLLAIALIQLLSL